MPYIYRVENEKGQGCYTYCDIDFYDKYLSHHGTQDHTPEPKFDKGINRNMVEKEICGFLNLEQAYNWFTKTELKLLEEKGFYLKKVNVSLITAKGQTQVLAIK